MKRDNDPGEDADFRARILASACEQVRRFGEAKTNVVDIARALGTSHTKIYRYFRSKADIFDALAVELMRDEEEMAKTYANGPGPAAERLRLMFLELYRRKHARFVEDPEIHDLHRRIQAERPDLIADYAARMTSLVATIIKDASERGEWSVNDADIAAQVTANALTVFIHPHFIAQWDHSPIPADVLIGDSIDTLSKAFAAGVHYDR